MASDTRRALFAIAALGFIVLVEIIYFCREVCGFKDKSQRRENHRNIMMTPINMVEERALPCLSRGRFRVRVGRTNSYSVRGTYRSGGSYSETDSEKTDKLLIYIVGIVAVCCIFFLSGLIYFIMEMCNRNYNDRLQRRENRRNIMMLPLNDIDE
ncbi:Hypothetical predicted protein [Mytilus galloprovincialis]|uniref:Uncharacterized protein n=1 Tax=Mytilus galloprovincialis TaxID=29158 RepID=A0A8B6BNZ7_MYTGA|nr:Hypothetical predicted protein [Mytilus galloprovincialis]